MLAVTTIICIRVHVLPARCDALLCCDCVWLWLRFQNLAKTLEAELGNTRDLLSKAEAHNKMLRATLSDNEAAMRRQDEEMERMGAEGAEMRGKMEQMDAELSDVKAQLAAANGSKMQLGKQLANSKEVIARITADNLMFLNKIKHTEAKMEAAVREREVLRVDLNTNDKSAAPPSSLIPHPSSPSTRHRAGRARLTLLGGH